MSVTITSSYTVSTWISIEQVKRLLETGELCVKSADGVSLIYIQFCDRTEAQELLQKSKEKK